MIGITDAQCSALDRLAPLVEPGTYLAGGVAIATAYGHRTSLDLDLFVPHDFDPERLEEGLAVALRDLRVTGRACGSPVAPAARCTWRSAAFRPASSRIDTL